jgi:hypothetical protein
MQAYKHARTQSHLSSKKNQIQNKKAPSFHDHDLAL